MIVVVAELVETNGNSGKTLYPKNIVNVSIILGQSASMKKLFNKLICTMIEVFSVCVSIQSIRRKVGQQFS
uniref:Uncharacterized protein n=1 Tax=Strongyloides venezuelensis TaxID=75913 RepID=A0A0K0EVT4_STRVS